MTTRMADPPTKGEAHRAAEELAAAGACRVLLFGSVARGDAEPGSDIDLVAVFDDIDYSRRRSLSVNLSERAEAASGRPVEVIVTDWPEWHQRINKVSSSFEAAIAPHAVALVERQARAVRWDKEIGLPDTNQTEALGRLDEAAKALHSMLAHLLPSEREIEALGHGDADDEDHRRNWRMIDICSAAAMAVETALKTLTALTGEPVPHRHGIHLLVALTGARQSDVRVALSALEANTLDLGEPPYHDITVWRQAGTYISDRPELGLEDTSRLAPMLAEAAATLTDMAADDIEAALGANATIERARRITTEARGIIKTKDLITGTPRRS